MIELLFLLANKGYLYQFHISHDKIITFIYVPQRFSVKTFIISAIIL